MQLNFRLILHIQPLWNGLKPQLEWNLRTPLEGIPNSMEVQDGNIFLGVEEEILPEENTNTSQHNRNKSVRCYDFDFGSFFLRSNGSDQTFIPRERERE